MVENKAITYSLLAHIRNSGALMNGPVDVFVPLIKRVLHKLNDKGIFKGESLMEIQCEAQKLYSIDFPLPVLKTICSQIANEINTNDEQKFIINNDNSFLLKSFYFEDFEDKIQEIKRETNSLEKIFADFCKIHNLEAKDNTSIFNFIDKNKLSISRYLSNEVAPNGHDYSIEAHFVDFFKKVPKVFDIVRRIYLGSIISSFLEYKTENLKLEVELLFDTNFIISLIDLNTPESTNTCRKLIEVGKNLHFKFTILNETIDEIRFLIRKKAETLDNSFLSRRINPEDIYNACERRNLNSNDLERIADNLDETIKSFGISINIYTEALKTKANKSQEFENFKKIRSSTISALHDTIAILYVKEKRAKKIREFEKVNCWFVNNSTSHDIYDIREEHKTTFEYQKETIKVDELLNILWLSQPRINSSLDNDDLIEIGLSSIVAYTLNESLPKANIIRDLEKNIQKYRGQDISDRDILNISTRIAKKQLKNVSDLNKLAETNTAEFVSKLKAQAEIQQKFEDERIEKFDELFKKFENQMTGLQKARLKTNSKEEQLKEKELLLDQSKIKLAEESQQNKLIIESLNNALEAEKSEKLKLEQQIKNEKKEKYLDNEVKKWQRKSLIQCLICLVIFFSTIIYVFNLADWKIEKANVLFDQYKSNFIIAGIFSLLSFIFTFYLAKNFYDKYCNNSNIKAFRELLKIPSNL
ncbi:coiled-coil domain-containing protein [Flavobacterium saccharophilum]|uniref:Uncharacterized protein n=1 Tax=Flavobacterium saccharophilum TaxID=29534 RepID=A0A1M7E3S4_9FLAO|nr:hypothetical protein [Flavobacterium saccharophilum]SHL86357.1 hypothetical protein SAMN05444366_1832 [Flavobacterium saccharophilum]